MAPFIAFISQVPRDRRWGPQMWCRRAAEGLKHEGAKHRNFMKFWRRFCNQWSIVPKNIFFLNIAGQNTKKIKEEIQRFSQPASVFCSRPGQTIQCPTKGGRVSEINQPVCSIESDSLWSMTGKSLSSVGAVNIHCSSKATKANFSLTSQFVRMCDPTFFSLVVFISNSHKGHRLPRVKGF